MGVTGTENSRAFLKINHKTSDGEIGSERFRMVALDMDGTLLGPDHKITDATVSYLRELHVKGFLVAIATGR